MARQAGVFRLEIEDGQPGGDEAGAEQRRFVRGPGAGDEFTAAIGVEGEGDQGIRGQPQGVAAQRPDQACRDRNGDGQAELQRQCGEPQGASVYCRNPKGEWDFVHNNESW